METIKTDEKAVGIILLERKGEIIKIHPVIWVKSIDTVYYETACGSGSLAVAIYLNSTDKINNYKLLQPSGFYINVELDINDSFITSAFISGVVEE